MNKLQALYINIIIAITKNMRLNIILTNFRISYKILPASIQFRTFAAIHIFNN